MTSLAFACLQSDKTEPAKNLLLQVTRLDPNSGVAYQYLGYCCLQLNEIDNAISNYTKAIEINKNDWEAQRGLGIAYILKVLTTRDDTLKAQAVKSWREALRIKPDQPKADKLVQLIKQYAM
jgi:tetratricopeptide (TPR) repeat protein